jgi:hypothetical protein
MPRKIKRLGPQECRSGIGWNATSHQPTRNFRIAPKIATIRFKLKVHPGDPGLNRIVRQRQLPLATTRVVQIKIAAQEGLHA